MLLKDTYKFTTARWNIYHLMITYPDEKLDLIKHVLAKLPAEATERMMKQRTKSLRNTVSLFHSKQVILFNLSH